MILVRIKARRPMQEHTLLILRVEKSLLLQVVKKVVKLRASSHIRYLSRCSALYGLDDGLPIAMSD